MSEILRTWLSSKLGIVLDFDLLSFGDIVKDGNLIGQLLCNYGVIKPEILEYIPKTNNYETALANLMYLNSIMKKIGIDNAEKTLRAIASGDGKPAIKLFYQLYLTLNNKNKMYYLLNQPEEKSGTREKEEMSNRESQKVVAHDLDSTAAVYKWHKNKYAELSEKCRSIREKYLEKLEQKSAKGEKVRKRVIQVSPLKDDLQLADGELEIATLAAKTCGKCGVDKEKAAKYVKRLKEKAQKGIEEKNMQKCMHKLMLTELLRTFIQRQENEFKESVTDKLLRQSYYEKQMASKLLEVRQQKATIIENRKRENEALQKKREQIFIDQLYQQKHNVSLANLRNERERQRILALHKKLYKEKCQRRYNRHYGICRKVMMDLVDLAIKSSEYQENFATPVPEPIRQQWLSLFYDEQPILDLVENLEDILQGEEEDQPDEILTAELYRQNGLDKKDLSDYLYSDWPWNLEEVQYVLLYSSELIELGMNVLGYAVHRVLLAKYPFPEPPQTPELPKVTTASCLVGVPEGSLVGVLRKVFRSSKIVVLDMEKAINYCVQAFLDEYVPNEEAQPKKPEKKGGKGSKKKEQKGKKPKAEKTKKDVTLEEKIPKDTQTPRLFPCEELHLSSKAEIGKYAHDTLNLGLTINNRLLSAIFVEYLKSFTNINGWVLINYPEKVDDAVIFELTLTGKEIKDPSLEKDEEEVLDEQELEFGEFYREDLFVAPSDEYEKKRLSKLLPNPKQPKNPAKNRSYLSSFVHLIEPTEYPTEFEKFFDDYSTPLEKFYTTLGCNNSLTCKNLAEPRVIKNIVANLTQDDIFAEEMYKDIITAVIEEAEERQRRLEQLELERLALEQKAKGGKKGKGKDKGKGKGKGKDKGKDKDKKKAEEPKPEPVKAPPPPVEEEVVEPPVQPGEPTWKYMKILQPVKLQKILATFWEDNEEIYMNDLKQVFFLKRVYQNAIVPYVHDVDTHMTTFIERPDNKQEFLHKFQLIFNEIDNDLREDDEFKAELHCRIGEFRSKLWDICVQKMRESEAERQRIIEENWFSSQGLCLTNLFITALQLEIDRSLQTFQFLQDYYVSMATQAPAEIKFNKFALSPFKPSNSDVFSFAINCYTDSSASATDDPFVAYLNSTFETAQSTVAGWNSQSLASCKKIDGMFRDKKDAKSSKSGKSGKSGKSDKKSEKGVMEAPYLAELKENLDPFMQEWQAAIDGENARAKYRLALLNAKGAAEISELLRYGQELFHEIYSRLDKRYHDELESVNNACEVFSKAVEAWQSVQPRMVLDGAKFYIEKNVLLQEEPLDLYEPTKEDVKKLEFSIEQLLKLTDIFTDLCPSDVMPTKTFMFLLQDMVVQGTDNDEEYMLPLYWHYLEPKDVQILVDEIFLDTECISWKDFIIYCLELPFPSETEVLTMRQQFCDMDPDKLEFVSEVQFYMVQFWFENRVDPSRTEKIKKLLCKMYKMKNGCVHYTLLLLGFCKDLDPIPGFAKALSVAIGCLVCWNEETGKNFVELYRYQQFLEEQERIKAESPDRSVPGEEPKKETPRLPMMEEHSVVTESFLEEEATPRSIPPCLTYFLNFETIFTVYTTVLPWHSKTQHIEERNIKEHLELIYNCVRNKQFDNKVLAHEFLNCDWLKWLIWQNNKFIIRSPASIVKNIVEVCTCKKDVESSLADFHPHIF